MEQLTQEKSVAELDKFIGRSERGQKSRGHCTSESIPSFASAVFTAGRRFCKEYLNDWSNW
jgi:hypothetical protein